MGRPARPRPRIRESYPGWILAAAFLAAWARSPAQDKVQVTPPAVSTLVADYARSPADRRDAFLRQESRRLHEIFSELLASAASEERAAQRDLDRERARKLATDLGERAERILGIEIFAADARVITALSEDVLERREALLESAEAAADILRRTPRDKTELLHGRTQALESAARQVGAFSLRHDDGDFARRAAHWNVEVARERSRIGDAEAMVARTRSIETLAALFSKSGLEGDSFYFLAEIEVASIYIRRGQLAETESALTAARKSAAKTNFPDDHLAQLLSLEIEVFRARRFDVAALDAARALKPIRRSLSATAGPEAAKRYLEMLADWNFQVAGVESFAGFHENAAESYREGLSLPGQRHGQILRAKIQLAQEVLILGAPGEATALAADAEEHLDGLDPASVEYKLVPALAVKTRLLRARAAADLGQGDRAAQACADAERRMKDAGAALPVELRAEAALVSGLVAALQGDLERAVDCSDRALAILGNASTATERIQALWAKANALIALGEEREALDAIALAVETSKDATFDREFLEFNSEVLRAHLLLSAHRAADALAGLDQALASRGKFLDDRPAMRGRTERLRAEARYRLWTKSRLKNPDRLEALLADLGMSIRDLQETGKDRLGASEVATEVLHALALVQAIEIETGRDAKGERGLATARAYLKGLDAPSKDGSTIAVSAEAGATMAVMEGQAAEAAGRIQDAIVAYKKAAGLEDRLRGLLRFRAPDGLSARFQNLNDRVAGLLLESAAKLRDPSRIREALLFLEDIRARSLRSLLARGTTAVRRPPADDGHGDETPAPRAPRAPRLTLDRLSDLMPKDRAAIVFALTDRGAFVVVLRGERVAIERIGADPASLERDVVALLQNLQGDPTPYKAEATLTLARTLYTQLIEPVAHLLTEAREIVIVPDGVLNGVPFGALMERPFGIAADWRDFSAAPFLIRRAGLEALTVVPSLATLEMLGGRKPAEPHRAALVLADPALADPRLPRLPFALLEMAGIRDRYPKDRVLTLEGASATWSRFKASEPGTFGIVHLATHIRKPRGPAAHAALLLAPERIGLAAFEARAVDIAELSLDDTQLVVLSSCASANGPDGGCEGILGLPRGFLVAGARHVVATAVEIQDHAAAGMMERFYAELGENAVSPAKALQRAAAAMISVRATSWPGAWAPFFVVGTP